MPERGSSIIWSPLKDIGRKHARTRQQHHLVACYSRCAQLTQQLLSFLRRTAALRNAKLCCSSGADWHYTGKRLTSNPAKCHPNGLAPHTYGERGGKAAVIDSHGRRTKYRKPDQTEFEPIGSPIRQKDHHSCPQRNKKNARLIAYHERPFLLLCRGLSFFKSPYPYFHLSAPCLVSIFISFIPIHPHGNCGYAALSFRNKLH